MTSISRQTYTVAHALAGAFGHTWGCIPLPSGELTPKLIDVNVVASDCCGPVGWGITSPTVDEDGIIRHSTATGRVSYAVGPDSVTVWFSRPGGSYLIASILWDAEYVSVGFHCQEGVTIYPRHQAEAADWLVRITAALAAALGLDAPTSDYLWEEVIAYTDHLRIDEYSDLIAQAERLQRSAERCITY